MWRVGGSIASIRLTAIALRFALTIFITANLGLEAMGQFGLVLGLGALAPALFGFGLNFHMARAIVGSEEERQVAIIRSRIGFTLAVLLLATIAGLPFAISEAGMPLVLVLLIAAILWGEALGMDIYIALTALRFNVLANFSLAMRSAFWIPVAVGLAGYSPEYANLQTILACWIAGQVANIVIVWAVLRSRLQSSGPKGDNWSRATIKDGLRIWPSDLALVLIAFGDRFILSGTVDERQLGIFVFFWSFANVAQTLVQAAIITPSLPKLIQLHREDVVGWKNQIRQLAVIVMLSGAVLGAGIYAFIFLVHSYFPQANFPWAPVFGATIIVATIVRFVGDFLSTVLNSAGAANAYSLLNVGFAVALMAALIPASMWGGIHGAALALLAVAGVFNLLKLKAVRAVYQTAIGGSR